MWKRFIQTLSPRRKAYEKYKESASTLLSAEVDAAARHYGVTYGRIAIRDQRRAWGSCSAKGNLNFSYRLLFLPPCLRRYVVVHELAHRRELNHSKRFWAVLAGWYPPYAEAMQALRTLERTHGTSLAALRKYTSRHVLGCTHCQEIAKENSTQT